MSEVRRRKARVSGLGKTHCESTELNDDVTTWTSQNTLLSELTMQLVQEVCGSVSGCEVVDGKVKPGVS